jgi:hypothetical protein
MQEQRTFSPAEEDAANDQAVMALLLGPDSARPWSEEEVMREIGKQARDSLNRLYSAGLIHGVHSFVWATRAAVAAERLSH